MDIYIRNLRYNQELLLSHETKPFILEEDGVDFGEAEGEFSTVDDIQGLGKNITSSFFKERDISVIAWIVNTDEASVKKSKQSLNRLINPMHEIELVINEYKIKVRATNSPKYAKTYRENNSYLCRFVLDFVAYYPFFKLKADNILKKSEAAGEMLFPLTIPFGLGKVFGKIPYNNVNQVYNTGDIEVGFELVVLADEGAISYMACVNNTTSESLKINEGLEKGEKFIISTKTGEKFVKKVDVDGNETDVTNKLTSESSLFMLTPGDNKLDFESDNNYVLKFDLKFSPSFMEVVG